jgi:hypothetical protein
MEMQANLELARAVGHIAYILTDLLTVRSFEGKKGA